MKTMILACVAAICSAACSSSPDELVYDCGMGRGAESWFRCEYHEQRQCLCGVGVRDIRGTALVCVSGTHGDWGLAADRVRAERGPPIAVVRCERVGERPGGGLPEPTIIVGASVGATGGDWPTTEPQADDYCSCD